MERAVVGLSHPCHAEEAESFRCAKPSRTVPSGR